MFHSLTRTLFLLLLAPPGFGQELHLQRVAPQTDASFRGLSVVDDSVAWVSGSNGWVGRSTDGGRHWSFQKPKGFEQYDFRSIYAFDAQTAVIANAGAPAYILYTGDAGQSWQLVYKNEDSAAFFDGIGFWNEREGIIYGDPIAGRMLLLRTKDGGRSWKELPGPERPLLQAGEASFAASGTSIRCIGNSTVLIATGGKVSRIWTSKDKAKTWKVMSTPILQGENSTGVFSVAWSKRQTVIITGGDYLRDTLKADHVFYSRDAGRSWKAPAIPTGGYRECVEWVADETAIAVGPGGTDISYDGGKTWTLLSVEKQYHVLRKARGGKLLIMAGGGGKISLVR